MLILDQFYRIIDVDEVKHDFTVFLNRNIYATEVYCVYYKGYNVSGYRYNTRYMLNMNYFNTPKYWFKENHIELIKDEFVWIPPLNNHLHIETHPQDLWDLLSTVNDSNPKLIEAITFAINTLCWQ